MKKLLVLTLLLCSSTAYGELYTWTDRGGTVHYTNSVYEIPARYLSRAKVLDVATGKKSRLNPAQLSGQSSPAPTAAPAAAPAPATPDAAPQAQAPAVAPPRPAAIPAAPRVSSGVTEPEGMRPLPLRKRRHFRSDDR